MAKRTVKKHKATKQLSWYTSTRNKLAVSLIAAGLLLIGIGMAHDYVYANTLQPAGALVSSQPSQADRILPTSISIGHMVDTQIEVGARVGDKWEVYDDHATYLASSARPREAGNIIIYGHNTREVLGNIRAVVPGQIITLKLTSGGIRTYLVTDALEVDPSDTSWLDDTTQEVLTVYTCSGLFDSKRFILRAKPLGEIL